MEKNKEIVLDGVEYVLIPKRPKDDVRNTLPKNIDPLDGLWMIFEEPKLKKSKQKYAVMQRSEQLVCEHKPIDFDVVTDTVVVCKCGHRWHR